MEDNNKNIILFEVRNIFSPLFFIAKNDNLKMLLSFLGYEELANKITENSDPNNPVNNIQETFNKITDCFNTFDDIISETEFDILESFVTPLISSIYNLCIELSNLSNSPENAKEISKSIFNWLLTINLKKNQYNLIFKLGLLANIFVQNENNPNLYKINPEFINDFWKNVVKQFNTSENTNNISIQNFIDKLSFFLQKNLNPIFDSLTDDISITIDQKEVSFTIDNIFGFTEDNNLEFDLKTNDNSDEPSLGHFISSVSINSTDTEEESKMEIKLNFNTNESEQTEDALFSFSLSNYTISIPSSYNNENNNPYVEITWSEKEKECKFLVNGSVKVYKKNNQNDHILNSKIQFSYIAKIAKTGFPPCMEPPIATFTLEDIELSGLNNNVFDFFGYFPFEINSINKIEFKYLLDLELLFNYHLEVILNEFSIVIPEELVKKYDKERKKVLNESPKITFKDDSELILIIDYVEGVSVESNNNIKCTSDPMFIGNPKNPLNGITIEDIDVSELSLNQLKIDQATIYLPKNLPEVPLDKIEIKNFIIDKNGISIDINGLWEIENLDPNNDSSKIFDVFTAYLNSVSISIKNNIPDAAQLCGYMLVPYFDEFVEICIEFSLDWEIFVSLSSLNEKGITLTKEELLSLTFKSFHINVNPENVKLELDGNLKPLLWSLDWPRFNVKGFCIEKIPGSIELPKISFKEACGDLKDLPSLDLFGFLFEINKFDLGFIEDTDKNFIDLTGNIKLLEALPIGVGVEGFKITWPNNVFEELQIANPRQLSIQDVLDIASKVEVKFDGVNLMYGVPGAVEFEGVIKFFKEAQKVGFLGDAELRVPPTGLVLEASILIGMNFEKPPYPFLLLSFGILLPAGIPLGQSGLAIKGVQGLLGLNVKPNMLPEQNPYYDWYKKDPEGAHKAVKWTDDRGSFAFGAGITITTVDGVILGVKGLLILVLPGPIIMIEGKALVFNGIFPDDGPLKALAYIDGREKNIQINIEASMELMEGIVEINSGIEAFFDFTNLRNSHIYIGKDMPIERRVYANILKNPLTGWLFQGQFYLMFQGENGELKTGVYIALNPLNFTLGIATVLFKAVFDGSGMLTINPFQFSGDIDLDAELYIKAFDFNVIGIHVSTKAFVTGALPLSVDAEIEARVELPIPDCDDIPILGDAIGWFEDNVVDIPDSIYINIPFHWEYQGVPKIPDIVKEVCFENNFIKTCESLKLFYQFKPFDGQGSNDYINIKDIEYSKTVPLDSNPIIVFDQEMNQGTLEFACFVNNENNNDCYIKVGKTESFPDGLVQLKPTLTEIKIYKIPKNSFEPYNFNNWGDPIFTAASENDSDKKLYGFWRAESKTDGSGSPSKRHLVLNSNNPFDFINSVIEFTTDNSHPHENDVTDNYLSPYFSAFVQNYQNELVNHKNKRIICLDKDFFLSKKEQKTEIVRYNNQYMSQYNFHEANVKLIAYDIEISGEPAFHLHCQAPKGKDVLHVLFNEKVMYTKICFCEKELQSIDVKNLDNNLKIKKNNENNTLYIKSNNGFDQIILSPKNYKKNTEIRICCICYCTKKETENYQQIIINREFVKNDKTTDILLSSNAFYKIEITHTIEKIKCNGIIWDFIKSDFENFVIGEHKTIAFFQTDGPPRDITPYVKWNSIDERKTHFFYDDDIVFRFKRPYINKLYPDVDNTLGHDINFPFEIEAFIKASDGKIIDGFFHNWKKAESETLLPAEIDWKHYVEKNIQQNGIFDYKDDILELRKYLLFSHSNDIQINNTDFIIENIDVDNILRPKWKIDSDSIVPKNKAYKRGNKNKGGSIITTGDSQWDDYIIECNIRGIKESGKTGILFHFQDKSNYYLIEFSTKKTRMIQSLIRFYNGGKTILAEKEQTLTFIKLNLPVLSMRIEVKCLIPQAVNIKLYINNHPLIEYIDSEKPILNGKIGFLSVNNNTFKIKNLSVFTHANNLLPSSSYELLLVGGEGGKLIFKDKKPFTKKEGWIKNRINNKNSKLCVNAVDDFEFISIINFEQNEQLTAEFLFRFPDETRPKSNKSFYSLMIKKQSNDYTFCLLNCNINENYTYEILNSIITYPHGRIKLRVRFIGNKISVWSYEKLIFSIELSDYTKMINTVSKKSEIMNKINKGISRGKYTKKVTEKEYRKRVINYQTAYDGLVGCTDRTISIIDCFELREVFLFKKTFSTSKFSDIGSLVEGINPEIKSLKINNINEMYDSIFMTIDNLDYYYGLNYKAFVSKVNYENKVFDEETLKVMDRELFEQKNQKLANKENQLDNSFIDLLENIGDIDLAYIERPERLTITYLKYESEVIGFFIHSPEPLNLRAVLNTQNNIVHGRMEIGLYDPSNNRINCFILHNSDSTKILLIVKQNDNQINSIPEGENTLQFNYIRDYMDDHKDINHLYDRPYELYRSSSANYTGNIKIFV